MTPTVSVTKACNEVKKIVDNGNLTVHAQIKKLEALEPTLPDKVLIGVQTFIDETKAVINAQQDLDLADLGLRAPNEALAELTTRCGWS